MNRRELEFRRLYRTEWSYEKILLFYIIHSPFCNRKQVFAHLNHGVLISRDSDPSNYKQDKINLSHESHMNMENCF